MCLVDLLLLRTLLLYMEKKRKSKNEEGPSLGAWLGRVCSGGFGALRRVLFHFFVFFFRAVCISFPLSPRTMDMENAVTKRFDIVASFVFSAFEKNFWRSRTERPTDRHR